MNQRRFFKPHFGIKLSTHASFLVRGGELSTNYNCQIYGRGREQLAGGETVVKRERERVRHKTAPERQDGASPPYSSPGRGGGPRHVSLRGSCRGVWKRRSSPRLLCSFTPPPLHHHRGACCHFVGSTNNTLGEAW